MTIEHIALIVGFSALLLGFGSIMGFKIAKRGKSTEKRIEINKLADTLDKIKVLPVLWVISIVGVGTWLITRVAVSYQ